MELTDNQLNKDHPTECQAREDGDAGAGLGSAGSHDFKYSGQGTQPWKKAIPGQRSEVGEGGKEPCGYLGGGHSRSREPIEQRP